MKNIKQAGKTKQKAQYDVVTAGFKTFLYMLFFI